MTLCVVSQPNLFSVFVKNVPPLTSAEKLEIEYVWCSSWSFLG